MKNLHSTQSCPRATAAAAHRARPRPRPLCITLLPTSFKKIKIFKIYAATTQLSGHWKLASKPRQRLRMGCGWAEDGLRMGIVLQQFKDLVTNWSQEHTQTKCQISEFQQLLLRCSLIKAVYKAVQSAGQLN